MLFFPVYNKRIFFFYELIKKNEVEKKKNLKKENEKFKKNEEK